MKKICVIDSGYHSENEYIKKELVERTIAGKNMVMFIVFFSSGLHYCMEKSQMIIPLGITDISSLYSASEKTNNSFYLYY